VRRLLLLAAIVLASLATAVAAPARQAASVCGGDYYKNAAGKCVHRPSTDPAGATAKCRDGTYSYSLHASGTCSHHGGVGRWIHHP
jgi:uncharacterized protein DUF3761